MASSGFVRSRETTVWHTRRRSVPLGAGHRLTRQHRHEPNRFRFLERLRVRWAEIDAQKIVFNGHYLMYFDTAIAGYWRALAMPYAQTMEQLGGDLFVRKATVEYAGLGALRRRARHRHALRPHRHLVDPVQRRRVPPGPAAGLVRTGLRVRRSARAEVREPVPAAAARRAARRSRPASRWSTCAPAPGTSSARDARRIRTEVFVDEQQHSGRHGMGRRRCRLRPRRGLQPLRPGARHRPAARARAGCGEDRPDGGAPERCAAAASAVRCWTRCCEAATQRGDREAMLHAQLSAAAFYERAGFATPGPVFEEAGIPHVEMVRAL